jgi:hypothetical protein
LSQDLFRNAEWPVITEGNSELPIHCLHRKLAENPSGVSGEDHGLWPWGNAKRRRDDAAFLYSTPSGVK